MSKGVQLKVGEDLFPRDFIVNIPPPSNYIGAAQLFGYEEAETGRVFEGLDIVRPAEDQEPYFPRTITRDNKDLLPDDVPETLRTAIKSFILTCAVRRLRGHGKKHNSMLVHVALRVNWIDRVAWLVNEILRDYKRQIRSGQGPLVGELQSVYEVDFNPTTIEVSQNLAYLRPKSETTSVGRGGVACVRSGREDLCPRSSRVEEHSVDLEYHSIEELDYEPFERGYRSFGHCSRGQQALKGYHSGRDSPSATTCAPQGSMIP
jgi:hypothetical protein